MKSNFFTLKIKIQWVINPVISPGTDVKSDVKNCIYLLTFVFKLIYIQKVKNKKGIHAKRGG